MAYKVLFFGEILWDVIGEKEYIGGAPFNAAAHLAQLNCDSFLVSAVGKDERGYKALKEAGATGVLTDFIQQQGDYPTGWVDVSILNEEHPVYNIHENVAFDFIEYNNNIKELLANNYFDFFYFGTLAQRNKVSRKTLFKIIKQINARRVFMDVNLRQSFYDKEILQASLSKTDILKLNEEEILSLSEIFLGKKQAESMVVDYLFNEFSAEVICLTRGARGCTVYYNLAEKLFPAPKVETVDSVGAGDAFSAGFIYYYLKTDDFSKAAQFGNYLGGFTASTRSAVPVYNGEKIVKQFSRGEDLSL